MNVVLDKERSVADAMIEAPLTVRESDGLQTALSLMTENHVSGLPVVDHQGCCIGVITASDILRFAKGDRDLKASRCISIQTATAGRVSRSRRVRWQSWRAHRSGIS